MIALRAAGMDAVGLPLIDIRRVADTQPMQQAWRDLPGLTLVMFVSANAVLHFMQQRPADAAWPAQVLAASTGPGTSAALHAAGLPAAALLEPAGPVYDSEALWQQLQGRAWAGRRVLVVRGEQGRDWLADRFSQAGATVAFVAAYRRRLPRLAAAEQRLLDQALQQPVSCLWLFSSAQAVDHLGRLAPTADWSRCSAVASHPRIVAAARQLGFADVALGELTAAALQAHVASLQARSIQSDAP